MKHRRLAIAVAVSGAVIVAALTGLAVSRPTTTPLPAGQVDASEPIPPSPVGASTAAVGAEALPVAEVFVRAVAGTVFDWDTATTTREDVITAVLVIADEDEANGLLADLDAYLPAESDWATLRGLNTAQHLDIDAVVVPESWGQIAADNAEQFPAGANAFTVTGTRRREGVWHGQAETYAEPVTFTAFIACTHDADGTCVLFRLSGLNKPLN